jgi:hypothetical protein
MLNSVTQNAHFKTVIYHQICRRHFVVEAIEILKKNNRIAECQDADFMPQKRQSSVGFISVVFI